MLSTFIKLSFVIKIFVLSILRGHFTQDLLYQVAHELLLVYKRLKQNCYKQQSDTKIG